MRIYLPSTFPRLAAVLDAGEVGGTPLTAYAVTERLAGPDTAADDEELEYEALSGAAAASLQLLREDPSAPRRRAVLAVEAPDTIVGPPPAGADHPAAVTVTGTVARTRIAAVHADEPEAEEAVAAAIADGGGSREDGGGSPAEGGGSPEDGGGSLEGHELLWFATQELAYLLGRD
ncbi:DUF6912 family protein [Streptomonospora salina]|uniref:Uncharacterized protein n=1 Tax=Streptomonospora salina TaxID=104205 RepID=A0A841E3A1_9ACTN|nr:hypothetical protein [Streptomonospora salina]MBB5997635.1 hypothetical protein [Streptomonospora salina]